MKLDENIYQSLSRLPALASAIHNYGPIYVGPDGIAKPEYVRLPKVGKRCPWTGLTRHALNKLILGELPRVESVVVADDGLSRGIRLIHFASLLLYLESLAAEQKSSAKVEGGEV